LDESLDESRVWAVVAASRLPPPAAHPSQQNTSLIESKGTTNPAFANEKRSGAPEQHADTRGNRKRPRRRTKKAALTSSLDVAEIAPTRPVIHAQSL
jgi:hypothetical protein